MAQKKCVFDLDGAKPGRNESVFSGLGKQAMGDLECSVVRRTVTFLIRIFEDTVELKGYFVGDMYRADILADFWRRKGRTPLRRLVF